MTPKCPECGDDLEYREWVLTSREILRADEDDNIVVRDDRYEIVEGMYRDVHFRCKRCEYRRRPKNKVRFRIKGKENDR